MPAMSVQICKSPFSVATLKRANTIRLWVRICISIPKRNDEMEELQRTLSGFDWVQKNFELHGTRQTGVVLGLALKLDGFRWSWITFLRLIELNCNFISTWLWDELARQGADWWVGRLVRVCIWRMVEWNAMKWGGRWLSHQWGIGPFARRINMATD